MSKIQNENIKSEAELIADGAAKSQLPNDDKVYLTANSLNKTLKEAIEDGDISGNAGNYIENPQAKVNTTGWVRYANTTPSDVPDNFGGTPNVDFTWTRNTTSPLFGTADFLLTKTANNRLGHGIYTPFDVENGSKTLMNLLSFLKVDSTSYVDGYIKLYLVFSNDNFVSDFFVVRPNNEDMLGGIGQVFKQFQFPIGYSKCRFCIHVATSTTTAWTVNFDNFFLGLSPVATSAKIFDEKSYTPSSYQGLGTPSNVNVRYSQVGDKVLIQGRLTAGTTTAAELRIALPNNYVSSSTYSTLEIVGTFGQSNAAAVSNYVTIEPNVSYITVSQQSASNGSLTKRLGSDVVSTSANISFNAIVKIQGLSSNAASSIDFGARAIIVEAAANNGAAMTANVTDINWTEISDNTSSWNGTQFTATESSVFRFTGMARTTTANTSEVLVYKNSTLYRSVNATGVSTFNKPFVFEIPLVRGDVISFRLSAGATLDNLAQAHWLTITKVASPQTILNAELVNMRYTSNNGQSIGSSATDLEFEDLSDDTHGIYNTTTGIATIPYNGVYDIACSYITASATWVAGNAIVANIVVNGTTIKDGLIRTSAYTGSGGVLVMAKGVRLNKGDLVKCQGSNSQSAAMSITGSNNEFSITRVGN